jgi:hypothetical protein
LHGHDLFLSQLAGVSLAHALGQRIHVNLARGRGERADHDGVDDGLADHVEREVGRRDGDDLEPLGDAEAGGRQGRVDHDEPAVLQTLEEVVAGEQAGILDDETVRLVDLAAQPDGLVADSRVGGDRGAVALGPEHGERLRVEPVGEGGLRQELTRRNATLSTPPVDPDLLEQTDHPCQIVQRLITTRPGSPPSASTRCPGTRAPAPGANSHLVQPVSCRVGASFNAARGSPAKRALRSADNLK